MLFRALALVALLSPTMLVTACSEPAPAPAVQPAPAPAPAPAVRPARG